MTSFRLDVELAEPGLLAQPGQVVVAERGAGDHPEPLLGEPGDGEVGLDAAAGVERLGVGEVADLAGHLVVAHPLEEARRRPARVTSILANDVSSNRPAAVRVATCSAIVAGDQARPAQPSRPQRLVAGARRSTP